MWTILIKYCWIPFGDSWDDWLNGASETLQILGKPLGIPELSMNLNTKNENSFVWVNNFPQSTVGGLLLMFAKHNVSCPLVEKPHHQPHHL